MMTSAISDPLLLARPTFEANGVAWSALTLGGRFAVNAVLRQLWPHPYQDLANRLVPEFGIEERKILTQAAVDRLNLLGWPLTLDSPTGRALALAHDEGLAEIAYQSAIRQHPNITRDEAFEAARGLTQDQEEAWVEAVFGLRPGSTQKKSELNAKVNRSDSPTLASDSSSTPTQTD